MKFWKAMHDVFLASLSNSHVSTISAGRPSSADGFHTFRGISQHWLEQKTSVHMPFKLNKGSGIKWRYLNQPVTRTLLTRDATALPTKPSDWTRAPALTLSGVVWGMLVCFRPETLCRCDVVVKCVKLQFITQHKLILSIAVIWRCIQKTVKLHKNCKI